MNGGGALNHLPLLFCKSVYKVMLSLSIRCFKYLILRLDLGHFQVGLSVFIGEKVKENTLPSFPRCTLKLVS